MQLLSELLHVLEDARLLHAATVHLPVALSVLCVPVAALLVLDRGRSPALRRLLVVLALGLAASAATAKRSGAAAFTQIGAASAVARSRLEQHESLASSVWVLGLLLAVVAALSAPALRFHGVARGLGAVVALLTAAWVGVAAHHGGTAVYEHGIGTRTPRAEVSSAPASEADRGDPRAAFFREEVRPLFERSCLGCHGPAPYARGGLDLSSMRGVLEGGSRGPAVVPGDAEASLLYQVVAGLHDDLRMPLSSPPLAAEEVEILRRWIDAGAVGDRSDGSAKS